MMIGQHEIICLSSSPISNPQDHLQATCASKSTTSNVEGCFDIDDIQSDSLCDITITQGRDCRNIGPGPILQDVRNRSNHIPPKGIPESLTDRKSMHFSEDFFDDLENFDLLAGRSTKKRKLSPKQWISANTKNIDVFDLSSDNDPFESQISNISPQDKRLSPNVYIQNVTDEEIGLPDLSSIVPQAAATRVKSTNVASTIMPTELSSEEGTLESDRIPMCAQAEMIENAASTSNKTTKGFFQKRDVETRPLSSSKKTGTGIMNSSLGFRLSKSTYRQREQPEEIDKIIDSSQTQPILSKSATTARTKKSAIDREAKREQRRSEKEEQQSRKKEEREQKRLEKQRAADIAEANKKKTDRKVSSSEMIVELPSSMQGKAVANQVVQYMENCNAQAAFYDEEIDMTEPGGFCTQGKVIRWKRTVKAKYDNAEEEWVVLSRPQTQAEKHVLLYFTAEEFCTVASNSHSSAQTDQFATTVTPPCLDNMSENIDTYLNLLRSRYPRYKLVLLVEGLTSFVKRIANSKNRDYQEAVRRQDVAEDFTTTPVTTSSTNNRTSKKRQAKKSTTDLCFMTQDIIEQLETHIQLNHAPIQIHHTTSPTSTARQIDSFTQHLSTRPYRQAELQRNLDHASFCMASGQVKTGQGDKLDTWTKMLEQLPRVTIHLAHGIANAGYENPRQLTEGFKRVETAEGRESSKLMLQDAKKAANAFGADSDKRLGPMVSRRLYKVFMGTDEGLRDGIA